MKKRVIFCILFSATALVSCDKGYVGEDDATKACEEAYFEGQKDALTGDVRIKKNIDSCWVWTKSCWDSGKQPLFNPSVVCSNQKQL